MQERGLRFYSPTLGRFLSWDPLGSGQYRGVHETTATRLAYHYVGNNGINNIDPLGLWCITIGTVCDPFWHTRKDPKREETKWEYDDYDDPGGPDTPLPGKLCLIQALCLCCRDISCKCKGETRVYGDKWQERTCFTIYFCTPPSQFTDYKWTDTKDFQSDVLLERRPLTHSKNIEVCLKDSPGTMEGKCRNYCASLNQK